MPTRTTLGEAAAAWLAAAEKGVVRTRSGERYKPSALRSYRAALNGRVLPRPADRAIYATALYAGLRRGELCALRWKDVDLERNLIAVERAWDPRAGFIEPKSRAGRRRVPIAAPLRSELIAHRLRQAAAGERLVFTNRRGQPFSSGWIAERASAAWRTAGLEPIGLHECRHTFAAFMIAAGVNAKALSTYMGHSSITITLDRYGHLMPGNEQQAADLLTTYLEHNRRATHQTGTTPIARN